VTAVPSRSSRARAGAAASLIAICALVTAAPAGALPVDPQKLVDSLGLQPLAGAPALPAITVPDPPSPIPALEGPSPAPPSSTASPRSSAVTSTPNQPASTGTEQVAASSSAGTQPASSQPQSTSHSATALRDAGPARSTPTPAVAGPTQPTAYLKAATAGNPLDAIGASLPIPGPLPDWSKPIIVVLLLIALALALRSRVMARRARRLATQRAALAQDVDAMQAALAPAVPTRHGPLEVSVAYRPAEGPAAGGDFYDVFGLDEARVAVIVGDVSGHGRGALARAAQTRFTLRAYLELGMQPRTALAVAGRRPSADPDDFATVAVGIYEAASGTLTYATAGHPPPIVLGSSHFAPVTDCASVPLGWGVPTGRRQTTVSLPTGAIACFYSDGLVEARSRGELLGRDRVVEMLADLGPSPQAAALLERLRELADEAPDDMAACLIQTTSAATGSVHLEEIELNAVQLSAGRGERFLGACDVTPGDIGPALRKAQGIAGEFGGAVLRVSLAQGGQGVVVEPPARDEVGAPDPPMSLANFPSHKPHVGHRAEAPTPGKDGQVAGGRVASRAARPLR
jgi:hypothetical protein